MATQFAASQRTNSTHSTSRGSERTFAQWLDAFADGECNRESLLCGVSDAVYASQDAGWELLALVDQYFRRHRIGIEDFRGLNQRLQSLLLAGVRTAEVPVQTPPQIPPQTPPVDAAQSAESVSEPVPPKRTIAFNDLLRDRYRVQGILGRGGMGTVYAAIDRYRMDHHPGDQNIALKVLHTDVIERPGLLAELRREFQCLQSLSHPNIVRVHEFDRDGDLSFFTMERLRGSPLSQVIAERECAALHRPYALAIIRQAVDAVAYAHSRGIVHGDLNPANIFVTDLGEIRVLDFGASCRLSPVASLQGVDSDPRTSVATPTYASCELLDGKEPTAADDAYALACICYVLLTGEHPFQCRNAQAARKAGLQPRRPAGIGFRQWRTLRAGLQFDSADRPVDVQVWRERFSLPAGPAQLPRLSVVMSTPPTPRQVRPWVSWALIALTAGLCWWAQDRYHLISNMRSSPGRSAAAASNSIGVGATLPAAQTVPTVSATEESQAAEPQVAPVQTPSQIATPTAARIELATSALDVTPLQVAASVPVYRRHNYRSGVSFTWSTEPGTAKPGRDFLPVKSRTEFIPAGERETRLLIPIVADPRRKTPGTFYVVINASGDGATLGSRTITMVTIPAAN